MQRSLQNRRTGKTINTVVYDRPVINRPANFVPVPHQYNEQAWVNRPSKVNDSHLDKAAKIKRNNAWHINSGVPFQPGVPHIPRGRRYNRAAELIEAQRASRQASAKQEMVGKLVKGRASGNLVTSLTRNNHRARSVGANTQFTDINTHHTMTLPRNNMQVTKGAPMGTGSGIYVRPVVSNAPSLTHRVPPSQPGRKWGGHTRTVGLMPKNTQAFVRDAEIDPLNMSRHRAKQTLARAEIGL